MNNTIPLIKFGWLRALLFVIPWVIFSFGFDMLASKTINFIWPQSPIQMGTNKQTIVRFLFAAIGSTFIIWVFRKFIDKHDFNSLGFDWKGFEDDGWIGFFMGILLLTVGSLILIMLSYLDFQQINFSAGELLTGLILMILVSYSEELIVRGYLLNNLLQSVNKWVALAITSCFFTVLHLDNPGITIVSAANIFIAGFLLGINYIHTKNLWFSILLHFSWNFFQGPVYSYEVSGIKFQGIFQQSLSGPSFVTGGQFGFEGSIVCSIIMLVALIILAYFFHKRYYPSVQ